MQGWKERQALREVTRLQALVQVQQRRREQRSSGRSNEINEFLMTEEAKEVKGNAALGRSMKKKMKEWKAKQEKFVKNKTAATLGVDEPNTW